MAPLLSAPVFLLLFRQSVNNIKLPYSLLDSAGRLRNPYFCLPTPDLNDVALFLSILWRNLEMERYSWTLWSLDHYRELNLFKKLSRIVHIHRLVLHLQNGENMSIYRLSFNVTYADTARDRYASFQTQIVPDKYRVRQSKSDKEISFHSFSLSSSCE